MKEEIDRAEEMSDVIVLSLHFGNEYEKMPNESQLDLVQYVVDEGADIILGTHPHVLQPVSWVQGKEGNKAFVIYSLGNFLSGQDGLYKQIGGIVNIEIQKVINGDQEEVILKDPKFLPTYVHFQNDKDFKIIPMNQLTDDVLMNAQGLYEEIKAHMSQWVPELEFIENFRPGLPATLLIAELFDTIFVVIIKYMWLELNLNNIKKVDQKSCNILMTYRIFSFSANGPLSTVLSTKRLIECTFYHCVHVCQDKWLKT